MSSKKRKHSSKKTKSLQYRLTGVFNHIKLPLLLFLIAFIPRVIVLFELTDSPVFYHPVIDSQVYHQTALEIAGGDFLGSSSFWQAPLYPYFLGTIYLLLGVSIFAAKFIQIILGAVNCCLIFYLAAQLFGRKTGWVAFLISVFYGSFIFFETELLAPVLLNFLILTIFLVLRSYLKSSSTWKIILVGVFLGFAQIGHGLIAAFLPFLVGWLLYDSWKTKSSIAVGLRAAGYLMVGFIPIILVVTIHNYVIDREFVLVSSNFGANFYLGNHPNYDSTTAIRPGIEWDEFIQEASAQGYRTPAQSSSYFSGKAFDHIVSDPLSFLKLLVKKVYLLTAGEEIKRNLDIYHFKQYSLPLSGLIWYHLIAFPSGLILPLAICWFILPMRVRFISKDRPARMLMAFFLLSQALAILLFFVSSRYRMPMMPFLIIFAAAMIIQIVEIIKSGNRKLLILTTTALIAVIVFCNIPRVKVTAKDLAENLQYEGQALLATGSNEEAVDRFRSALELKPDYAMAKYNLAQSLARQGENTEAERLLDQIVRENPQSFIAHLTVGRAYLDRGKRGRAEQLFNKVLEMNPNSAEALVNLGDIYRVRGDTTTALQKLRSALVINPRDYKACNQIGAIYLQNNQLLFAEQNFLMAYKLNHSYVSALNNLATLYARINRIDDAEELMVKAVKLSPDDPNSLLNYGAIMLKRVRPAEALEYFDHVVEIAPEMPQAHHYRGIALLSLRQVGKAKRAFQTALSINPNFTPSRNELQKLGR